MGLFTGLTALSFVSSFSSYCFLSSFPFVSVIECFVCFCQFSFAFTICLGVLCVFFVVVIIVVCLFFFFFFLS